MPDSLGRDYPAQTIKLIVPFVAGGPVDALARSIAPIMQTRLGQKIMIENRSGAGTAWAPRPCRREAGRHHAAVRRPEPRLLPGAVAEPRFRSAQEPRSGGERSSPGRMCWRWRRGAAPRTLGELIAYAKANPNKLAFGFGLATMPHIIGEVFKRPPASS